ncbi:MAG TPA: LacI family DNA-binding transcriptional regulator [Sphaerochaetaceae bacterium]|jgi:DNA-binding LacI/PurR family transcriptional regulator|nr:LacI family DNA-binding transcriptional regulator [Sphaerochaetaceae bacterium]
MDEHRKNGKRVTIKDIARITGYSKTAVSFAFNDPSRISKQACETIHAAAEKLGYYPDPLARRFSLQRHESIGFLLPQHIHYSFQNPYIMQVVEGIGSVCQKYGNTLTLIPPLNESVLDAVRHAAVDGLITQGMSVDMEIVDSIRGRNIPFVTVDGVPSRDMPSVNIDDRSAAKDIMSLVLAQGHREIVIIGLADVSYEKHAPDSIQKARLAGYQDAMKPYGLSLDMPSVNIYTSECTLIEGRLMATKILESKQRPTCVVCMSDIVAIGCLLQFSDQGVTVPDDISVIGFDNIVESSYMVPPLTTIGQPASEKGRKAAEMLFALIRGEPVTDHHVVIPYRVLERESLGPAVGRV